MTQRELVFATKSALADGMWELALEPENGPLLPYAAGQVAWINLGHSPFSLTEHPFSISSAPVQQPRIAFTIKESGDFTRQIGTIPIGTRSYIDGSIDTRLYRRTDGRCR